MNRKDQKVLVNKLTNWFSHFEDELEQTIRYRCVFRDITFLFKRNDRHTVPNLFAVYFSDTYVVYMS